MTEDSKIESLANILRERIKRGDFGTSGRIPSVTQLAKDHQMARATVYQALHLLQSEGLLLAKENSHYVNYPLMRIPGMPAFDRYLTEQGLAPSMDNIIEPEIVSMPVDVAMMFGQQEGVRVVHRMRRQGTPEVPYRLAENWYPADLTGQFLDAMKQDPNLNVTSEIKRVHGVSITKVHEDVLGRLPTHEEAKYLNLVRTAPVLEIRRRSFSQDDRPVMFNKIIMVAVYFMLSYDYELPQKS